MRGYRSFWSQPSCIYLDSLQIPAWRLETMAGTEPCMRERCSTYMKRFREHDEFILWKLSLCALIAILDFIAIGNLAWLADVAFANTLHLDYYPSCLCHNILTPQRCL